MSTAVIDFPQTAEIEEEAAKRKAEARRHFDAIKKAGGLVSTNSLKIGWHAYAMKRSGLFGILGFESEGQVWEATGISASTWYAQIRLAELFDGISEDDFCSMKGANASALSNLPKSKRMDSYWIKKAATESMDTFDAMVDAELDGDAKRTDGKERTVSYSVKMTKSQKKAVDSGLQEISKELGCEGNTAKTIELLVAERRDGVSLIGTISHAIERIASIKQYGSSGLSAAEALERAYLELDGIVEEFRIALENSRNNLG